MSASRPGSTTYSSGYGPRTGTIRKADPYSSPVPPSPRNQSPRAGSALPPAVDVNSLSYSASEQYKLKKYRDEYADQVAADVKAFYREEEIKASSARRRRGEYRDALQEQIRQRSASRDSERDRQKQQKKQITKDFDDYIQDTLRHKEDQRQKHLEYCRQVQQQHANTALMTSRQRVDDEAVAEMINRDAQLKKQEDDSRKANKRALQAQLAQDMMREHDQKRTDAEMRRLEKAEADRAYLKYMDEKAAHEEHVRANHIKSHQKILPSVTLPKIENRDEPMPDYITQLAEERKRQGMERAEQQRLNRETLLRQIEERNNRKQDEKKRDVQARLQAEEDARRFHEETRVAKAERRTAAKDNVEGVMSQIQESIRRQYRLDDDEWKSLSTSSKK